MYVNTYCATKLT